MRSMFDCLYGAEEECKAIEFHGRWIVSDDAIFYTDWKR